MILICDRDISTRAQMLQDMLAERMCPCAVCSISEIRDYLPAWFIITFCDVFDDLRRAPYDDIFALVIGDGFVNTALNAARVSSDTEALQRSLDLIKQRIGVTQSHSLPFGVLNRSVFFCDYFIESRGSIIPLTDIEMRIFRYIFLCSADNRYAAADMIRKYCYSAAAREHSGNVISVHIANINKKSCEILGQKLIGSMRHSGYYIEKI